MFEILTVIVVLGFFAVFAFGAIKAEKVVNAKAVVVREAHAGKATAKTKKK